MMRSIVLVFLVLLLFLVGCDQSRVYEESKLIPDRVWHKDSIRYFDFVVPDDQQNYRLYYTLRNTMDYPYQNLYLNYTLLDSSGNELRSALQNMDLFTRKTGRPLGKGSVGDIYEHQIAFLRDYRFAYSGQYRMAIQHYMRRDTLPGILSVGLRLEAAESN